MKHLANGVCGLALIIGGCGPQGRQSNNRAESPVSADVAAANQGVRACRAQPTKLAGEKMSFSLQNVSYSASLYPILQDDCSECHKPSIENRQNSTNCLYIRDNLDNVVKRLYNARDAAQFKTANPAATNDAINGRYPRGERPMPPIDKAPLTEAEIKVFESWKGIANPCGEADAITIEAPIPKPKTYSSDSEESSVQNLNRVFASASCEDGPDINTEPQWQGFLELLKRQDSGPNATQFYDYAQKKYLDNVSYLSEGCSMEGLIGAFSGIPSFRDALSQHAAYGWRVIQCGGEKAVGTGSEGQVYPRITIGSLSRITTSLGDFVYGLNIKDLRVVSQQTAPKP